MKTFRSSQRCHSIYKLSYIFATVQHYTSHPLKLTCPLWVAIVEIGFLICVVFFFFFQYVGNELFLAFSFSYLQRYWSWYISTADAWGNHWCWKYAVQLHAKKHSSTDEPPAMDTDRNTASVLEVTGFIEITYKKYRNGQLKGQVKG